MALHQTLLGDITSKLDVKLCIQAAGSAFYGFLLLVHLFVQLDPNSYRAAMADGDERNALPYREGGGFHV